MEEVIAGYTEKLGADHTNTLRAKNNLASLRQDQGKPAEAEALYQEVIAGRTEKLGADHTRTLRAKYNFGTLFPDQGKTERARQLLTEAHDGCLANLGADHPHTQIMARTLSRCVAVQFFGNYYFSIMTGMAAPSLRVIFIWRAKVHQDPCCEFVKLSLQFILE